MVFKKTGSLYLNKQEQSEHFQGEFISSSKKHKTKRAANKKMEKKEQNYLEFFYLNDMHIVYNICLKTE